LSRASSSAPFHSSRLQPGCDARPCHCHGRFSRATRCNRCICAMLLISIGYSELNKADPDCGRPSPGQREPSDRRRAGRRLGIIASDVLVMASLAEVAGQYGFLLFNANGIGNNPTSPWVLLVGVLWIVVLAYICYRASSLSMVQRVLLAIELVMLASMRSWRSSGLQWDTRHRPHGAYLVMVQPDDSVPQLARRRSRADVVHLLGWTLRSR